jgi:hypothetical protein
VTVTSGLRLASSRSVSPGAGRPQLGITAGDARSRTEFDGGHASAGGAARVVLWVTFRLLL